MTKLERYEFSADQPGLHIVFLGNVHGNEPYGRIALERLRNSLQNGNLSLKQGRVTLLPCCNPQAAAQNMRFVDVNLNRMIGRDLVELHKDAYECDFAHQIMDVIDTADILIDLHSFTQTMPPCVMCIDESDAARALAKMTAITRIVCDSPFLTRHGSQTTVHYARSMSKPAVLVECGSHNDPTTIEVAYDVILRVLQGFNMIEPTSGDNAKTDEGNKHGEYIVIRSAIYRHADQELAFPLSEVDFIKMGDPLFHCLKTDKIVRAEDSGYLFMKNANTPKGEEYAYICDFYNDWPRQVPA